MNKLSCSCVNVFVMHFHHSWYLALNIWVLQEVLSCPWPWLSSLEIAPLCIVLLECWQKKLRSFIPFFFILKWPVQMQFKKIKYALSNVREFGCRHLVLATHRQRSTTHIPSPTYLSEWQCSTVPLNCSLYSQRKNVWHLLVACVLLYKWMSVCVCLKYMSVPRISKNKWFPMSQPNVLGNIHFNAELDEKNDITLLFTINMKLKPVDSFM